MIKKLTKILWFGNEIDANGKAIPPSISPSLAQHLQGLNRGELYISDNPRDPALFIRTSDDTVVRVGGSDIENLSKYFLSKIHEDRAAEKITFAKGIEAGEYMPNSSGAKIDEEGNAEVANLQVNKFAEFRNSLSSEEFISGFVGGKGWAIIKQQVLNALGIPEQKYTGEFDNLIVRGTLRVFEMIISQLLGENDNRIFTAMMEVDHYDPETGRIWLDTHDGKMYNPFRRDDYIMVQQYNGMPSEENNHYVTKSYELIITEAGSGSSEEGENRLDWVEFKNFTSTMEGASPEALITKGDTLTRVDNATDPDRKGIVQIITVGNKTPYLDVIYGLKTDPDNYLKGRLGNLEGIKHHLFGWLQGFGELLTNLYAVGDMRLRRTGESLDSKIEALEGVFSTQYTRQTYDLTEESNYLHNASFALDLEGWRIFDLSGNLMKSNGTLLYVGEDPLIYNGVLMQAAIGMAALEDYDGRKMMHLRKGTLIQSNALVRKPAKHKEYKTLDELTESELTDEDLSTVGQYREVPDTLYFSIKFLAKSSGMLTFGFGGGSQGDFAITEMQIEQSLDWQTLTMSGVWDGLGDFKLSYTGDMYISLLAITDKPLNELSKTTMTKFEQTDAYIRMTGRKIDKTNNSITELGREMDVENGLIRDYITTEVTNLDGSITTLRSLVVQTATEIRQEVEESVNDLNGLISSNRSLISQTAEEIRQEVASSVTTLDGKISSNRSLISQTAEEIRQEVASSVTTLDGKITTANTRIQQNATNIGLHAQRISDTETNIANLTVSIDGIQTAVVSVKGDADAAQQAADVAQQAADDAIADALAAQRTADGAASAAATNATAIRQNAEGIAAVAARFNSDGTLKNKSGLVTTAGFAGLFTTEFNKQDVVTSAEIAVFVDASDVNNLISRATIKADKIDFTGSTTFASNAATKLGLGDLAYLSKVSTSKVTGLGALATKDKVAASSDVTGLGALATKDKVAASSDVTGLGSLATKNSVSADDVTGLGALAKKDSISTSYVTGLGSLATLNSVSYSNLVQNLKNLIDGKVTADDLGDLAYVNKVSKAMLNNTIIDGGYILTSLIDVDSLYVKHLYAGDGMTAKIKMEYGGINWSNSTATMEMKMSNDYDMGITMVTRSRASRAAKVKINAWDYTTKAELKLYVEDNSVSSSSDTKETGIFHVVSTYTSLQVIMKNLPTSIPSTTGQVYRLADGTLKVKV